MQIGDLQVINIIMVKKIRKTIILNYQTCGNSNHNTEDEISNTKWIHKKYKMKNRDSLLIDIIECSTVNNALFSKRIVMKIKF